jgi:hypothetical protein
LPAEMPPELPALAVLPGRPPPMLLMPKGLNPTSEDVNGGKLGPEELLKPPKLLGGQLPVRHPPTPEIPMSEARPRAPKLPLGPPSNLAGPVVTPCKPVGGVVAALEIRD